MEDFGQRVDLTARIREVLLNYPEGTSLLKELLQNADDAGATRVAFVNDRRSFPTGAAGWLRLRACLGPRGGARMHMHAPVHTACWITRLPPSLNLPPRVNSITLQTT